MFLVLEKLHAAIIVGETELALSLIKTIPVKDYNACGHSGYNALHLAIRTENTTLVSALLPHMHLHTVTAQHESVLHLAAALGNIKIMNLLLAAGATVCCSTPNGNTPLHVAAESLKDRDGSGVSALIEAGAIAQLNAKNLAGDTPLKLACKQGHYNTAHILFVTYGATRPDETFLKALAVTKPEFVTWLRAWIKTPVEPIQFSMRKVTGNRALYCAVQQGKMGLITTLFQGGADPLAQCGYPETPFQLAKKLGNTEALELFKTLKAPGLPSYR